VTTFTEEQIANWDRYEEVRAGGEFNMFDSRARSLTDLDKDEYFFVMQNYAELKLASDDFHKNSSSIR